MSNVQCLPTGFHDYLGEGDPVVMSSVHPQGFTAIRVRATRASLLCDNAVTLIEVYAGCPCNRYLKFHYPYSLTPQDVLTGNPKDNLNQALLYNLEVKVLCIDREANTSVTTPHDKFFGAAVKMKEIFSWTFAFAQYKCTLAPILALSVILILLICTFY